MDQELLQVILQKFLCCWNSGDLERDAKYRGGLVGHIQLHCSVSVDLGLMGVNITRMESKGMVGLSRKSEKERHCAAKANRLIITYCPAA